MLCNPEIIALTGGEPLIRNDFLEIIKYIKSKGNVLLNIMTNATLITQKIAAQMSKYVNSVDISLDGFDEESCSYIRGENVYGTVLNNIKLLQQEGLHKISLSMVSLTNNKVEEEKFKDLCEILNVTPMIRRLSLKGRAKKNEDNLNKVFIKGEVTNNKIPSIEEFRDSIKACACQAGTTNISIDEKGYIYPCGPFMEEVQYIENILKIENLDKFLNSKEFQLSNTMKVFTKFNPYEEMLCKNCDVRYFCWTCPSAAKEFFDNKEAFETYCEGKKEFLHTVVWGEN